MSDASNSRGGNGVSKQNTSEATADGDRTRGSRGSSGLEGPDKVRKLLLKRIGQLHRAYAELHQITAQRELDENKARTSEVIAEKQGVVRWPQLGLQSTTILRAAAQGAGVFAGSKIDKCGKAKGQEQKVKIYSSLQGTVWAPAVKIPYHERIPAFKAWSYLMSNELATEVGARIFYTDATGETIPASDSEDEDRKGEGNLEGAHRESEEWVMRQLAAERGVTFEVVDALAQRLDAANSVVEARLTALLAEQKEQKDLGIGAVSSVRMGVEKCAKSFCRRCRIYNCVTHISGGDVRPHHRLPASATIEEVPCGPHCWRVVQRAVSEPRKAGTTSDPASHAVLGSQHQQQPGQELTHEKSLPPGEAPTDAPRTALRTGVILREQVTLMDTPARPRRIRGATPLIVALGASSTSSGVLDGVLHAASNGEGVGGAAIHCLGAGTDWNAFELDALQYCRKIYMGDACRTARYIGARKCSEVQAMMEDVPELSINAPSSPPLGPARRVGSKRKPAAPQRRKNAAQVVNKRAKHDMTKPWPRYTPCTCVGPCNADCSCAKSKNFCEKFCACGPSCTIRFVGCDCKSGCRTKACPCFAAGHECDPDLCIGCTKSCACNNMRLRFRQHKRVSMGKSDIAGWGSFLLEAAKKGDLVGEYTGELVTQTEADRRGKAYDRDDNSYLFNLNEEWVIDARRRGNKLRFANHSTDPNCAAKILMVDGDHRVGIYACKDILPGTELFYDYCYQPDQAPVWAQLK